MLKGVIESLLFITNRPLTKKELANLVEEKVEDVEKALEELVAEYAKNDKGIKMVQNGKEFQMVTDPANSKVVQKFLEAEVNKELTPASLETLSIIAYRAPISREELEQIRGINCAIILRHLLIKGLIAEETQDDGKQVYDISLDFLRQLGINKISELPDYEQLNKNIPLAVLAERETKKEETPAEDMMSAIEKTITEAE